MVAIRKEPGPDLNRLVHREPVEPVWVEGVTLRAYFEDLEEHLIEHIREADAIVGCVAWLTSEHILGALASVPRGVSLIVQKEDFLRPDLDAGARWKSDRRIQYEALRSLECWPETLNIATHALIEGLRIEPVRCAGLRRQKFPTQPRMHHKFLVFCKQELPSFPSSTGGLGSTSWPEPYAVWTGSFNFTANGCKSLENAIFIKDNHVARSFYQEWQYVAWLSEPLNWSSRWVNRQWSVT